MVRQNPHVAFGITTMSQKTPRVETSYYIMNIVGAELFWELFFLFFFCGFWGLQIVFFSSSPSQCFFVVFCCFCSFLFLFFVFFVFFGSSFLLFAVCCALFGVFDV